MGYLRCVITPCAAVMLSGCYLGNQTIDVPPEADLQDVRSEIDNNSCVVEVLGRPAIKADSIEIREDSVAVFGVGIASPDVYPIDSVSTISFRNPERGALLGLASHAAGAAGILGCMIAVPSLASGYFPSWDIIAENSEFYVLGITLGGLFGMARGAIAGGNTKYEFKRELKPSMPADDSRTLNRALQPETNAPTEIRE
jgi:hypothetical protein